MLHGIINEQGNCLDVSDGISEKKYYFHMFSYISLASGAFILGNIVIADIKPMDMCFRCYKNILYHIFPNAYNTKIYRDTNRK